MAGTAAQRIETYEIREVPFGMVLLISIAFHVFVLVVIPLLTSIVWRQSKFERPKTFQLVSVPLPPRPQSRVPVDRAERTQRMAQREATPEPRPVPAKTPAKTERAPAKEKEAAKPLKENLDELASLLEEIPAPAAASSAGEFPYPWYLRNMEQKVQRYWTPPGENRKVSVTVAFTVRRDGSASDIRIAESSGNSTLDNLAVRAVTLASPFGKMPPGFGGEVNEFRLKLHPTTN